MVLYMSCYNYHVIVYLRVYAVCVVLLRYMCYIVLYHVISCCVVLNRVHVAYTMLYSDCMLCC